MSSAAVDQLIATCKDTTPDTLAALRPHLADDVIARGLWISGEGADAVLSALASPPVPVLSMLTYEAPVALDSSRYEVRATAPEGLPIREVVLTVTLTDGRMTRIVQEVVQAKPAPELGMLLDETVAEFVDTAFARNAPLALAYVDEKGRPHLSYRGSLAWHDKESLALWVRDPSGGLLAAIESNPHVAILGSDHSTRTHYEFLGRARVESDPTEAERIYTKGPDFEKNVDAGQRGVAVVIDVDMVRGGPLGQSVFRVREAPHS